MEEKNNSTKPTQNDDTISLNLQITKKKKHQHKTKNTYKVNDYKYQDSITHFVDLYYLGVQLVNKLSKNTFDLTRITKHQFLISYF